MKLIRKINKHEMLRRWAIAEACTDYLKSSSLKYLQETMALLHSNYMELEEKGIMRSLKEHHLSLVDCMPADVSWFLAGLELKRSEFDKLLTLPVPEMGKITNHTYQVSQAAGRIWQNPFLDPRITGIKDAFISNHRQVQLSGITVLAQGFDGPYTIIEGNGRLISLYGLMFFEERHFTFNDQIEVVIGLSEAKFKILYEYLE